MTFRRVMIVVISLLAAMFVYMLVDYWYSDWLASLEPVSPGVTGGPPPDPEARETLDIPGGGHVSTEGLDLEQKDETGRVVMRLRADRVIHSAKNTSDITRPRVVYYTDRGETITISGREAQIVTQGDRFARLEDVERGVIRGDVVLIHGRDTPNDPLDDYLVGLDELRWDNRTHVMSTDGPVDMAGERASLSARGMRMTLDSETRRVTRLTFERNIMLTLDVRDEVRGDLIQSPLEATPETAASKASSVEAGIGESPASASQTPARAEPPDDDLWRIEIEGDVLAHQAEQRLRCARLELYTALAESGDETPAQADATQATDTPGVAPAGAAPSTPEPMQEAPPADLPPPLVLVADGPLHLTPVEPDLQRTLGTAIHEVTATGAPVTVEDGQTRIRAATVRYNSRTGAGHVDGTDETPMVLDQPDRLHLTGRRLDFSRTDGTVLVSGAGELRARVESDGLTGAADPAEAAPGTEGDHLEARWQRRMALNLYPEARGPENDTPQIRRAEFEGKAVVRRSKGRLQGEHLIIDFLRAEARAVPLSMPAIAGVETVRIVAWHVAEGDAVAQGDRLATVAVPAGRVELEASMDATVAKLVQPAGALVPVGAPLAVFTRDLGQAVSHLKGHGDVVIRNPPRAAGEEEQVETGGEVGDIACQNLDLTFLREPDGRSRPHRLEADGDVIIRDPKGEVRAEKLSVRFGRDEAGDLDIAFVEAFGDVLIDREDLHAEGDHVRRDAPEGELLLKGTPAVASRGERLIEGDRIEFSQTLGKAAVTGAGRLRMPVTTDLQGRPVHEAVPLAIRWSESMYFEDARGFANFNGDVVAETGAAEGEGAVVDVSRLASRKLWVYFREKAPRTDDAPTRDASDELAGMMEGKAIERILAEEKVAALDQKLAADGTVRSRFEITGPNLTYLAEKQKSYIRGPGRVRILSRPRPAADVPPPPGVPVERVDLAWGGPMPPGYARTVIDWQESMAYEGETDRAYFKGDVVTTHEGRSMPGERGGRSGRPVTARVRSGDLLVIFSERASTTASNAGALPEQRMTIEKLVADGGVNLLVDDRRGTAERMIYTRDPERVSLYAGPRRWARLWQESESEQQFNLVVARVVTYSPATGRIEVVDQQEITISP